MGTRGIRPNAAKNIEDEPMLIVDVNSIIDKAKKDGYIKDNVTNIKSIIENEGVSVKFCDDMPSSMSGKLECLNGVWIISINNNHHPNRRRFTMAHELAHYFLHKGSSASFEDTTFFRDDSSSPIEYAANDFASKLLMPEVDVRSCIDNGVKSLNDLADTFKVSIDAMKNRIKSLGYKTKTQSHE